MTTLASAAAPVRLKLARDDAPEAARRARFLLGRHFLDGMHMLSAPHGLDPAMVLIAETVAVGTIERSLVRNGRARPAALSRRAIALATGLPRETVRRRLQKLVEMGLLVEGPDGIRCAESLLAPGTAAELSDMLARHVALTNLLIAEGLIEADASGRVTPN